ncbi:DHA2 family efflux MFS transporter permease subunit [Tuberibacillus sp. Marseille-P3662]|uniref:DHA2 family efflux MFS transporter permease subunit n=1 Tax=Tuberibacillus sp. Marseille-P3662 TaxID=1965358 RepID=UPI000A1C8286|nr:DHA2 family efflux MFS transporter permease subunit [Tuberibacillus sp. Marseille-P3662]
MANEQSSSHQNLNKPVIIAVILAGAFVVILNQTLLNTAIPKIMADLSVSANTAQWLTTGFMLTNGVMIPVTAFLIQKFSTRQLFITAMSLFATGTLIAAFAPSFPLLLIARIVQAAGAGIMIPLMQTVFLLIFPVEKRGAAMGMVGLVIAFAPAIGPTLSGWIVESHSWRVLFYMILPIALLDIIFATFALKNVTKLTYPKIDIVSIILSSLGFGSLLYGFSSAGNNGWSSTEVIIALIVGVITLGLFIWRQLTIQTPMLEFRVFKNKIFALTVLIGMIVMVSMIGVELLLPLYMQNARGYSPLESGLLLLPGAVVMGIMSPITGRVFDKIGARPLAIIGLAVVSIMTFLFSNMTASTTYTTMMIIYAIRMFGISLVMMPVMTAGLNQLPDQLIPHGTAMNNTMRQVAASIGTATLVTVMTNNTKDAVQEHLSHPMIHGVSVAFMVAACLALFALILSFFIKPMKTSKEDTKESMEPVAES